MAVPARITGRVRDQENAPGTGYTVKVYAGRTHTGDSNTASDGSFGMELAYGRKSPKVPLIRIEIFDSHGGLVLKTDGAQLTGRVLDFQVKLGMSTKGGPEPDIYANGLRRLVSAYRHLEGRLDPSSREAADGLRGLVKVIRQWDSDRKRIERAGASKVVQVPKHPRRARHRHVTKWDEVVVSA